MKRALRFFTFFFATLGCIAIFLWGAGSYFNKEVKQAVVNTINQQLIVPVDVRDIQLTLFKDFPNAAVELNKVLVPNPMQEEDTLLYAEQVFLSFNLWDIFKGTYNINRIKAVDGYINLIINEAGDFNYKFWNTTDTASIHSKAQVNIDELVFKNINTHFTDLRNVLKLSALGLNAKISGQFAADAFKVNADLESPSFYFSIRDKVFFADLPLSTKVILQKSDANNKLEFIEGYTQLQNFRTAWQGHFQMLRNTFEITYTTEQLAPIDLKPFFPKEIEFFFKEYNIDGKLNAKGKLYDVGAGMQINCGFDLTAASMNKPEAITLKNVSANGTWKSKFDEHSDNIKIDAFSANFLGNTISGSALLKDFSALKLKVAYTGKLDYLNLCNYYKLEAGAIKNAVIDFNLNSALDLSKGNWENYVLGGSHQGLISCSLAEIMVLDKPLQLQNVQVNLKGANSTASLQVYASDMLNTQLKLSSKNLVKVLVKQSGWLSVDAATSLVNLDVLLAKKATTDAKEIKGLEQFLPQDLHIGLSLNVKELVFQGGRFQNLQAQASLSQKNIRWQNTSIQLANGNITSTGSADITNYSSLLVAAKGSFSKLEMAPLFKAFNNFEQEVITYNMISGSAEGSYSIRLLWDKNGVLHPESTELLANTRILNGKLQDVPLLADISDYLRKNLITKTLLNNKEFDKRLKVVNFDTLSNEISLRNGVLLIPEMNIRSSAFNLDAEATYQVDSKYVDAGFSFMISELFKKRQPEASEFGYVIEEPKTRGIKLYLRMTGTPDDISFSLDKLKAKTERKERLKDEVNSIKEILRNPATSIETEPLEEAAPQFELDWNTGDDGDDDAIPTEKKEVKDNKSTKTPIFKPKQRKDDKTETEEFDFSDDDF